MPLTSGPPSFRSMAVAVRGRAFWLPPLLLFAAVLLLSSLAFAIANLDRGEEVLPQVPDLGIGGDPGVAPFGPTGTQLQLVWQITIASIFVAAFLAVVIVKLKGGKLRNVVSVWELLGYAFGVGVILFLVLFWPAIVDAIGALSRPGGTGSTPGTGGGSGLPPFPTSTAFPIALFVFAAVLIAVYFFAASSRALPAILDAARRREPDRARRRFEAAGVVTRTLLDLEAGGDFRTAVMACYQRMCSLLETKGVVRQEALTPREIEGRALAELGLSQGSVDDLTGLFEEARYSDHAIGPAQRDRARDSLNTIRRELGG